MTGLKATVLGHVQGVFFREFTRRHAFALGITGYVRNRSDGSVEVVAEGERASLEMLLNHLREGPPAAEVKTVEASWSEASGMHVGFSVRY